MKGQGAIEFLVLTALAVALATALIIPSARENETNSVLSSARLAGSLKASEEGARLTGIETVVESNYTSIRPLSNKDGFETPASLGVKQEMITAVKRLLYPAKPSDGPCAKGLFTTYCIN